MRIMYIMLNQVYRSHKAIFQAIARPTLVILLLGRTPL